MVQLSQIFQKMKHYFQQLFFMNKALLLSLCNFINKPENSENKIINNIKLFKIRFGE